MAIEKNISQLPSATGVSASDFIHVSQGGVDKKIPATDMSASFTAGQVNDPVVKEESSTSRTLTIADKYAYIQCSNTSLTTITVLADTLKAGNFVNLRNVNGGGVTLAAGAGVIISGSSSGLTLSEDKQVGTLLCTGTNTFDFMTGGSASTSIQGAITFPDVATMISGDTLEGGTISDWSGYVGWQVQTVVNNTTSNEGGWKYEITASDPGDLSTFYDGVWKGKNHSLPEGYFAKMLDEYNAGVYSYGAVDAGSGFTIPSGQLLFDIRVQTDTIRIPKTENGILVDVSNFTGIDQEYYGEGSIREPHLVSLSDRGVETQTLGISGTATVHNLNFKGSVDLGTLPLDEGYPGTSGRGLAIITTTNRQWTSVRNMFISGYDEGVYHDSAYYMEYHNVNLHNNNTGFKLDDETSGAVGSSPFYGGHIRNNHTAGMELKGNNDFRVLDTVFEFNRIHIMCESGSNRFNGCYLGDGPWQIANASGGTLILDQQGVSSLGSGGNLEPEYSGSSGINKKVDYHCGGIDAANVGTVVEVHNALIERNIYANYGVSDGTRDNGSDLRSRFGAKMKFYNTRVKSYFPVSYSSDAGSLRGGDILNNYFINGLFDRVDTLPYDIAGAAPSNNVSIATVPNPFSEFAPVLTKTTNDISYAVRFSVPPEFIGKEMAMCILTGPAAGISNRNFGKSGFSITGPNFAETSSSFWVNGGIDSVAMAWYTATINATEGFAQLLGTTTGASDVTLYGFILTEVENYQKLGNYQDSFVRRVATNPPTAGAWSVNDTFIKDGPSSGNTKHVCTVAGTPGTWITE